MQKREEDQGNVSSDDTSIVQRVSQVFSDVV